jgi:hypothetical protein
MSTVKSANLGIQKLKGILKSPLLSRTLFITLFLFTAIGGMFGAYAADFQGYDVTGAYKTADEVSKESTGVDGKNSQKSQSFQLVDTLSSTMDVLAPQLNMNYQAMLDNPNIPTSAKLGVLGFSDAALTAMVYNPPSVDVSDTWLKNGSLIMILLQQVFMQKRDIINYKVWESLHFGIL